MTGPLRVLVVDDARLARRELGTLLAELADVECVGEADDVPTARDAITRLHPDVVLLDIQLPSGSGFDVLDGMDPLPEVIFVTAYDDYAVRAFEANALDYLLKPVAASRLRMALDKARARMVEHAERRAPDPSRPALLTALRHNRHGRATAGMTEGWR